MNVAAIGKRPAPVAGRSASAGVAAKGTGRWSAHKIALWEPLCQALRSLRGSLARHRASSPSPQAIDPQEPLPCSAPAGVLQPTSGL